MTGIEWIQHRGYTSRFWYEHRTLTGFMYDAPDFQPGTIY